MSGNIPGQTPIRNTTSVLEGERDNPSKMYPFEDAIEATDPDHTVYNHLCVWVCVRIINSTVHASVYWV